MACDYVGRPKKHVKRERQQKYGNHTVFAKINGRPDVMWPDISFRMSRLPNRPLSTEAVLRFDLLLIPDLTKVTETSVRFADNCFRLISTSSSVDESIRL